MKQKNFTCLIIIMVATSLVFFSGCTPLSLKGQVCDEKTWNPIAGASIYHPGRDTTVVSDENGEFILPLIRLEDTIRVTAEGFRPATSVFRYYGHPTDRITVFLKKE